MCNACQQLLASTSGPVSCSALQLVTAAQLRQRTLALCKRERRVLGGSLDSAISWLPQAEQSALTPT